MTQKNNPLPQLDAWRGYEKDMDARDAFKMFHGKSNVEMMREYKNNVLARVTDLRFMPAVPFQYYVLGFRDFILSGDFGEFDAPDSASGFIGLIHWMTINKFSHVEPVLQELVGALEYVAENQEALGANEYIYGSFFDKLSEIKEAALK